MLPEAPRTTTTRRLWYVPLAGALLGALLSLLLGPHAPTLGPPVGDQALARDAREILGDPAGYGAVSVARIRDGETAWAGFPGEGASITPDTRFELGSITKTFTGLLLVDAAERREVALDDAVERHLPELAGTPAGAATLEELASHRSGLPGMARDPWVQLVPEDLAGTELSVFQTTTADLLNQTRSLQLTDRGTFAYSNLGISLLGHALARAAGAPDWQTHVTDRLLTPLGMTGTRFIAPGQHDPGLTQPRLAGGRAVEPWTGLGYAPAGAATATTAADMTLYAEAILNGTAPGLDALEARWPTTGPLSTFTRAGLTWMSSGPEGADIQWHNGGTGGTRTMLAINRHEGAAALIFNSSRTDVTGAGLRLAGADEGPPRFLLSLTERDYYWFLGLVPVLLFAIGALRGRNRLGLISRALWAVGGVLLIWLAGPWNWVPGWVFGLTAGAVAASLVVVGLRWSRLPWPPRRFLWVSVPILALGAAFLGLMLAVTVSALQIG